MYLLFSLSLIDEVFIGTTKPLREDIFSSAIDDDLVTSWIVCFCFNYCASLVPSFFFIGCVGGAGGFYSLGLLMGVDLWVKYFCIGIKQNFVLIFWFGIRFHPKGSQNSKLYASVWMLNLRWSRAFDRSAFWYRGKTLFENCSSLHHLIWCRVSLLFCRSFFFLCGSPVCHVYKNINLSRRNISIL